LVNISASPYQRGKTLQRERMFQTRALDYGCPVLVCNLVGGQDELVFDGNSAVFDSDGSIPAKAKAFEEDSVVFDLKVPEPFRRQLRNPRLRKELLGIDGSCNGGMSVVELPNALTPETKPPLPPLEVPYPLSDQEEVLEALKLGLKDYVTKNGFSRVVVGLSGGIDSALVASLAVLTLGKENVLAVSMPSRFTSELSFQCIKQLSENLGVEVWSIPIDNTFASYLADLEPHFYELPHGTAEENIQARIRGNLLMAVSNKLGYLVLATGNKSELSVGYCTLYGDMAGGFALIKDVPKTLVYELAHLVNQKAGFSLNPEEVIFRPPSAELKEGQKDEDSLPPYRELDTILQAYVEEDASLKDIVGLGFSEEVVRRVIQMVDSSEYKRRQAPPGVKITPKAFGKDRRMPITQRFFVE
jgi:NAD+ synthase (glutamine-hydrolysing)